MEPPRPHPYPSKVKIPSGPMLKLGLKTLVGDSYQQMPKLKECEGVLERGQESGSLISLPSHHGAFEIFSNGEVVTGM